MLPLAAESESLGELEAQLSQLYAQIILHHGAAAAVQVGSGPPLPFRRSLNVVCMPRSMPVNTFGDVRFNAWEPA